jgi:DNA processing protein
MSAPDEEVLLARAYLSRVAEPANLAVWAFVSAVGAVDAARAIRNDHAPHAVRRATEARRAAYEPAADLDAAQRHGIRLIVPEGDQWPHFAFGALERAGARRAAEVAEGARAEDGGEPVPPLALWVKGDEDLPSLGTRAVGIVGARASTSYGERVASDLAFGVAQHDVVVVSGGAYGIDAAAHRGALAAGGQTVIVSAGGVDRPYPQGNRGLFARVVEQGLILSESPPGSSPQRQRFLSRNRLIAALATGSVVVEAGVRSGAANTAAHCRTLGRVLMAVPGPVTSAMSAGCHALLRRPTDAALLVTDAQDVLAALGFLTLLSGATAGTPDSNAAPTGRQVVLDALDPTARRVFEALAPREFASAESISKRAGVAVLEVIRALPVLDLAGLVETSTGGYRVAASAPHRPG